MVPEQIVSVDVQIFYKKYGFNIFSHTYGCLIKNFVTERFVSLRFLVSCNSPRVCCERRSSLPLTHAPAWPSPNSCLLIVLWKRARTLTQTSNARVVWMMLSSPQAPQPPSPVQGSSWFPRQSLHFSPHLPMSRPKHGSKMACTESK